MKMQVKIVERDELQSYLFQYWRIDRWLRNGMIRIWRNR
jgi:hypothetical protein